MNTEQSSPNIQHTIHRKYNGVAAEPTFYVVSKKSPDECKTLRGADVVKFLKSLKNGSEILVTSASSTDIVLMPLVERGVKIYSAHWHSTGIDKGLPPDEIALAFSRLSQDVVRPFVGRPDLAPLRGQIMTRNAFLEYRKAAMNRLNASAMYFGEAKLPQEIVDMREQIMSDSNAILKKDRKVGDEKIEALEKTIIKTASAIDDCRIFNRICGMKNGLIGVSAIVSYMGDISRYPTVSSLWHYAGYHVVDGHAPRRERGVASDWNSKLKKALWLTIDACLKNNVPRIRDMYEEFKAEEIAAHPTKCPDCKTPEGHCGARARRRVIKELLRRYYAEMGGPGKRRTVAAA